MKFILLTLACAASLLAETYAVISTQTAVTTDKVTIAANPASPSIVRLQAAVILSTTAGTVTVRINGTAPTATLATPTVLVPGGKAARAKAYTASDVGAGTAVSVAYPIAANTPLVLDLTNIRLSGPGTTKNMTISVAIASGNVSTAVYFDED